MLSAPGDDGVFRYEPPKDDDLPQSRPEDDDEAIASWFDTASDPRVAEAVAAAEAVARQQVPSPLNTRSSTPRPPKSAKPPAEREESESGPATPPRGMPAFSPQPPSAFTDDQPQLPQRQPGPTHPGFSHPGYSAGSTKPGPQQRPIPPLPSQQGHPAPPPPPPVDPMSEGSTELSDEPPRDI